MIYLYTALIAVGSSVLTLGSFLVLFAAYLRGHSTEIAAQVVRSLMPKPGQHVYGPPIRKANPTDGLDIGGDEA